MMARKKQIDANGVAQSEEHKPRLKTLGQSYLGAWVGPGSIINKNLKAESSWHTGKFGRNTLKLRVCQS